MAHLAGVERLQVCGEGGGVEVGGHAQLQPLRHPDLLVQGGHHHVDVVAVEVVQVVDEPAQVAHQLRQRGVDLLRQVPGQLLAGQLRLGLEHEPRPREHAVLVDLDRVRVLGAEVHAGDVVRDEVAVHGEGVLGEHRLDGDVLRGVGARDDPGVARDPVESADVDLRLDGDGAGEAEVVLDGAVRARLDDLIEEAVQLCLEVCASRDDVTKNQHVIREGDFGNLPGVHHVPQHEIANTDTVNSATNIHLPSSACEVCEIPF